MLPSPLIQNPEASVLLTSAWDDDDGRLTLLTHGPHLLLFAWDRRGCRPWPFQTRSKFFQPP